MSTTARDERLWKAWKTGEWKREELAALFSITKGRLDRVLGVMRKEERLKQGMKKGEG